MFLLVAAAIVAAAAAAATRPVQAMVMTIRSLLFCFRVKSEERKFGEKLEGDGDTAIGNGNGNTHSKASFLFVENS